LNSEMSAQAVARKNLDAEIFSAPIAGSQLKKFLKDNAETIRETADFLHERKPARILFIGSGASWTTLYSGLYVMDRYSRTPAGIYFGPELEERQPQWIGPGCAAILASYSGKTADTLSACKFLRDRGVATVSICRDRTGPLAGMTDRTITYQSKCLYTSPMAAVVLLASFLLQRSGEHAEQCSRIQACLDEMADRLTSLRQRADAEGEKIAQAIIQQPMVYFIAGGPLYGLGYQVAYTWIMEYLRRDAAFIHHGEFRHGPLEVLRPGHPCTVHMLGNDEGRWYAEGTYKYCLRESGNAVAIDVKDFCDTHPALNPLVVFCVLNYMLFHAANRLGIDLDEYVHMHVKPYFPGETYY